MASEFGENVLLLAHSMADHSVALGKVHEGVEELPDVTLARAQHMEKIVRALTQTGGLIEEMLKVIGEDQDKIRKASEALGDNQRHLESTVGQIHAVMDTSENPLAEEGISFADATVASVERSITGFEAANDSASDAVTTLAWLLEAINEWVVKAAVAQEEIAEAGAHAIHALDDVRGGAVTSGASYEKLHEYGENL